MVEELRLAMKLIDQARAKANQEEWWLVSGMLKGAGTLLNEVEEEIKPLVQTLDNDEDDV